MSYTRIRPIALVFAGIGLIAWCLRATDSDASYLLEAPANDQAAVSPSRLGAESFQTDLFTGGASTSIPIVVPPGTGGMQPSLALAYASGNRNSIETFLAPGWDLSGLGYVERSTKFGAPSYTTSDSYVLNGSDLVFVSALGLYHTKDESFSRVEFFSASNYWLVTDKNGTQMRFGGAANSRSDAVGRSATRRWALDLVTDLNGNQLSVTYTNDSANGMIYPLTITYTQGNGQTTFFRTVEFRYETQPNPITSYRYGAPITINQRLAYIDVKMNGAMVRRYELAYTNSTNAQNALLTRVQEFGADANPTTRATGMSLPAYTLDYSASANTFGGAGSGTWVTQTADRAFVADLTGDGRTDLLYCTGSQWRVAASTGTTFTNTGNAWGGAADCSAQIVSLGDFNGDGKGDEAVATATGLTVYLSTGTAFTSGWTWTPPAATNPSGNIQIFLTDLNGDGRVDIGYTIGYSDCGNVGIAGPCKRFWGQLSTGTGFGGEVGWARYSGENWTKVLDLNGDGKADLLLDYNVPIGSLPTSLVVALSTGSSFASSTFWLSPHPAAPLDQWRFGDFNGDGLVDFLALTLTDIGYGSPDPDTAEASVYLSKGNGFEAGAVWMSETRGNDWDAGLITTGDFNGDGKTDLVSFHHTPTNSWTVRLSRGWAAAGSYNGFSAAGFGDWGAPSSGTYADVFEDFDGDGKTDRAEYFIGTTGDINVRLAAGPAIHLATVIHNSIGGTTTNTYRSSVNYANTYLPFPVQTVGTVTTDDGMEHQSITTYNYQGGKYDQVNREFWGFAQVTVTDPTGAYSKTNFLQTKELRGRTDLVQTFDSTDHLFGKIDNTWAFSMPYTGVTWPYLQQTDTYTYDGTATPKQAQTKFAYDSYGNVNRVDNLGDVTITTDDRYDYTEYTYSSTANLLSLPSHMSTRKSDNSTVVSETWNYYDDATTHTATPVKGRLTKVCRSLAGGTNPCTSFGYDVYGNRTSAINANGKTTSTAYDTLYHTFPVTTTSPGTVAFPSGLVVTTTYWGINSPLTAGSVTGAYAVPGLPATVTDPNNVRMDSYWDVFGRSKATVTPPNTAGSATTVTTYLVDGVAPEGILVQQRESVGGGTIDSYRFMDGLGRVIQTKSEAPSVANQQVVVDTTYNNRGLVDTVSIPYTVSTSGSYTTPNTSVKKTTTTYDPARRVTQVTNTDNTYTSAAYSPWTTTVIDANGRKGISYRDAYGRVVKTEAYTGSDGRAAGVPATSYSLYATTRSNYDALGNLLYTTDAAGNVTNSYYDTLGRATSTRDPDLGYRSYQYDAVGNVLAQTDQKGQKIEFTYDGLNRVLTKTASVPLSDSLLANISTRAKVLGTDNDSPIAGFIISGTTPKTVLLRGRGPTLAVSGVTGVLYDPRIELYSGQTMIARNDNWQTTDPLCGAPAISCGSAAQITATGKDPCTGSPAGAEGCTREAAILITLPPGPYTMWLRGVAGGTGVGIVAVNDVEPVSTTQFTLATYTYDTATNGKGRLASVTDPTGGESFSYDVRGNVTTNVKTIGATSYTTRSLYDSLNRVTTLTYPDNEAVLYEYNFAGALKKVGSYVTNIDYNVFGQRTAIAFGNLTSTTYTYDPNHFRLNSLLTTAPGSVTLQNLGYGYDAVGNIKNITDNRTPANSQSYEYDDFSRLTSATVPAYDPNPLIYRYDNINNMTCNSLQDIVYGTPICSQSSPNFQYPQSGSNSVRPHAVTSTPGGSYTYDANGNRITGGGLTITYNAENRATSFASQYSTLTATYDYTGERVTASGPYGNRSYFNALWECSATCTKYIFAGGTRIAKKSGSTVLYYHPDHLGSTTVVTGSNGGIQEELAYLPYGAEYSDTGSLQVTHRYTSQEVDFETGLHYYHARYYDAAVGRFLQPDTMTSEHYMYARNNPIMYTDPTGHYTFSEGGVSATVNPIARHDTSAPDPSLTNPPPWATPGGMDLGSMDGGSEFGLSFSLHETRVIGQAPPNTKGGTITLEQFNGMMSGNEAIARFVYTEAQYAGIFTPEDISAMTWDHGGFWNVRADIDIKGQILDGPQRDMPEPGATTRAAMDGLALYEERLQSKLNASYARFINPPGYGGARLLRPTPSNITNQPPKTSPYNLEPGPPQSPIGPELARPKEPWYILLFRAIHSLGGGSDSVGTGAPMFCDECDHEIY